MLFACYSLFREEPIVVTVLGRPEEVVPGTRQREHLRAMDFLGLQSIYLESTDRKPDWEAIERWMAEVLRDKIHPTEVYVPAWEHGGHEQHNWVTAVAGKVFADTSIVSYMTYTRGGRRSRGTIEVEPEHGWSALKFQAMACYTSQIEWVQTRPWFAGDDALREWLA